MSLPFSAARCGPALRAVLTCATDEGLRIGDRVRSVLVAQGSDAEGNELFELRFSPEKGA